MPPTPSASGSQGRQATLFGFFGKPQNGPAPINTQAQKPTPVKKQHSSSSSSALGPDTPPPSVSRTTAKDAHVSDSTVKAPLASSRREKGVETKTSEGSYVASSPLTSRSNGKAVRKGASLEMTPPSSSPPARDNGAEDEDDDDDEGIVSRRPRRSAAASKRSIYAESGDEMDLGSDSDADAYSPPQEERPTKKPKRFSRAAQDSDDEFADDDFIVPDDDELDLIESQALKKKKQSTAPKVTSSKTSSVPVKPSATSSASRLQVPAGRSSISSVSSKPTTPTEEPYEFLMNPLDEHRNPPSHPDYDKRTLFIPEKTLNKLTPFEKQFWAIKRKHNDTVLFFQKGKFYELYEDDAVIAHREFGLKMTDRVRMKMAGVPESSFITFANKFLALGYKVGRVDQCETAVGMGMRKGGVIVGKGPMTAGGDDNKIVRRELKHIYTNGTIVDADCLPDEMSSYCVSIKEVVLDTITRTSVADKNDESLSVTPVFGVCFLDAGVAEFKMRHFVDDVSRTQLETLLRSMRIKEVIHEKGGLSKRTLRIVKNTVAHDCNITMLKPNAEFYDAEQTLRKLNLVFNSDLKASEALTIDDVDPVDPSILPDAIQQVLDKPEALSALGGMLNYLTQLNLEKDVCASRNFDVFDPAVQQGSMILDAQSLTHLNVLMNEQGDTAGTLLSLVNRACTPFGKRLMRIWLLSPLSNLDAIHARQEAVEALMTDSSFREDFDVFAKSLPDIERIRPRIYAGNCKSRDFARVLKALTKIDENVELLADRASTFTTKTVESVLRSIPAVSELAREIQAMYQDEQSFEPKSGAYEPFDQADKQVEEVERSLNKELARAATAVKLPRDRVKFKDIGTNEIYQIEVPVKTKVPIDWALVSQTQSVKRYYSPEVRQLVKLLKEGRETRVAALKDFQANLFRHFQEHGDTFLLAVKGIAELDCLVSLAKASYAMGEPSCRPEFVDSDVAMVDFEELRHPCLASASTSEFIANDISLGVPSDEEAQGKTSARVTILTGGNMAGKSTTARTTATAVILAQLGCRVPASKARLSTVDRIASRMGANDQLFRNNSTFMVEMLEASRILKDCTPRSLIIMDELGRGTSTFDGQAIAYAVLHHLIGRTRSLSFFLTHYTSLAHEFDNRFGVANKHMQVLVDSTRREVVFTYKLVHGIAESSYGTEVAALAGVPLEICDRATHISRDFAAATKEAEKKRLEKLGDALSVATLSDFAMLFKAGLTKSTKNDLSTASVAEEVNVDDETVAFLRRQIGSVLLQRKQNGAAAASGQDASSSGLATMRRKSLVKFGHKRRRTTARTPVESDDEETIISQSSSVKSEVVSATKPEREKPKRDGKQMILDLGQRLRVECRDCQMSYDRTDPKDVAMHRRFHLVHTHGIECTVGERAGCDTIGQHWIGGRAWKTFNEALTGSARSRSAQGAATIWRMELSRLVSSSTTSVKQLVAKTMKQMDDALGAVALTTDDWRDKTLLIAELDGRVVGTALLGPVRAGVRLQRVAIGSTPATADHTGQHVPPLALYRIYVVPALRRAGLASAMLNAALQQCVYGMDGQMLLKRFGGRSNLIAFCQPTDPGRRLAEAWAFNAQDSSSSQNLLLFDES